MSRSDVCGYVVALLVAGCERRDAVTPDAGAVSDGGTDRLVLGTCDIHGDGFLPFASDQVLVSGVQGGFHVWLKLRIADVEPGPVKVHRTVQRTADERVLLDAETILQVGTAAGGYWEQPYPLPLFLCPTPSAIGIVEQRVDVHVVLTSAAAPDALGDASASFTVHCPDDARAACIELCSG